MRSNTLTPEQLQKESGPADENGLNTKAATLTPELLHKINAYWRAANYLSVGQIYLYNNPLLKVPLNLSDVKPLMVGHRGTVPGQNFIYVHLNRLRGIHKNRKDIQFESRCRTAQGV